MIFIPAFGLNEANDLLVGAGEFALVLPGDSSWRPFFGCAEFLKKLKKSFCGEQFMAKKKEFLNLPLTACFGMSELTGPAAFTDFSKFKQPD